ncbi:hypothetical protein ABB37_05844 [Leptomonas pyrrhocoris]|uniref:Uncharacterized protein n=1 Tax=Leptomonas pyrrhocoris TaxID=157538 RepID=A0A0M9FYR0_LEPPY|nr:hypothetical protein ABB37_05844 [Leptomonas pyrrhocoris]KPA78713.1 hypothetical protein ABB37_05844 [Leptomonas pyrrhocoris]|eukprot:XP_015657152.1 hypothetical protein ABB37_05844 [Leptomonas pyrrhocoris]
MGATGSAARTQRPSLNAASPKDEAARTVLEVRKPQLTSLNKKANNNKRQPNAIIYEADSERCKNSHVLNAPAPILSLPQERKASASTNGSSRRMKTSLLPNERRQTSAPLPPEPPATTAAAAETYLIRYDNAFWDSLCPKSPCDLQRVPELESRNFRRVVTKVNLRADADVKRKLSRRRASSKRRPSDRPAAAVDGRWWEGSIPYVRGEENPRTRSSSEGALRTGYSYVDLMQPNRSSGSVRAADDNGNDRVDRVNGTDSSSPAEWALFDDDSTTETLVAPQRAPETDEEEHRQLVPKSPNWIPPSDDWNASHAPNTVTRKGTFGVLMPIGKSVVISKGGLASFRNTGNDAASNNSIAGEERAEDDLLDNFLMMRYVSDMETAPTNVRNTASTLWHYESNDFFPYRKRAAENPPTSCYATPPGSVYNTSSSRTASQSVASRRYPLPQPLMYGPRNTLTRSRRFDIERVLGFERDKVRRVPSPDWRRLDEVQVPHDPPCHARRHHPHHAH